MKKTLLFFVVLLLTTGLYSQVLLLQDFSSGQMPPTGWMILGNQANFANSPTANAGGTAPECRIKSTPAFNSTMRFIAPATNTYGMTKLIIQLNHRFEHSDANSTPFTLAVETRSSASSSWNEVWSVASTSSIAPEILTIAVNNSDVGSPTFQFAIKLTGNSQAFKDWYIDNITLMNPSQYDAAITKIDVPELFVGHQAVKGTVTNVGLQNINSAKVTWTIPSIGTVHTDQLNGLNLATGATYNFTCTDSIIANTGNHSLVVYLSDVNGTPSLDNNLSNDTLTKSISIPDHLVYRRPMIEEFTSSTCAPCASFNNSTLNPFITQHGDEVTLIKYQMNWPGSGDIYYTAEGGVRRSYYGVSAVPDLYVDGKKCGTNSAALNAAFNTSKNTMTYLEIASTHEIQGNKVIIDCNILPYANYSGITMQMGIIEKVTTGNVGSNGETSFHNVMMKMVPDASGTALTLTMDQPYNFKSTMDMTGTHVEQMDDLQVAIFIQATNKEILNSNYSTETGAMATISPTTGTTNFPLNGTITINYSQAVRLTSGLPLTNDNIASIITFKKNNNTGVDIPFTATIDASKTKIIITPTANLESLTQYFIKVDELENNAGINTLPVISTFTTIFDDTNVEKTGISTITIYPNPANERIIVKSDDVAQISKIELINTIGKVVRSVNPNSNSKEISLHVKDIQSGIYFVRVLSKGNYQTSRVVITH